MERDERIESALITYYMPPEPGPGVIEQQQLTDLLQKLPGLTFGQQATTLMNQLSEHHPDVILSKRDHAILTFVDDAINKLLSTTDLDYKVESLIRCHAAFLARTAIGSGPVAITKPDAEIKLLDLLLRRYVGWSEDLGILGNEFMSHIEDEIISLANGRTSSVQCLHELQTDLNANDRAFKKMEERLNQIEVTNLLQHKAQTNAANLLNQTMAGQKLPMFTIFLLQGAWYEFLQETIIQCGTDGAEWKKASKLTEALIWSLQARKNSEQRSKVMNNLPDKILSFCREISPDSTTIEDVLLDIRSEYESIQNGNPSEPCDFQTLSPNTDASIVIPPDDDPVEPTVSALGVDEWYLYQDKDQPEDRVARLKLIMNDEQAQSLLFTNHCRYKTLRMGYRQMATNLASGTIKPLSITDTASTIIKKHFQQIFHEIAEQTRAEKAATEKAQRAKLVLIHRKTRKAARDKALAKQKDIAKHKKKRSTALRRKSLQKMKSARESVARLQVEAWVNLPLVAGKLTACKLVAIMPGGDKYIFADRAGAKVAEYTARQLSSLLVSENSEIIETGDEFDKNLSSIIIGQRHNRTLGIDELTGDGP